MVEHAQEVERRLQESVLPLFRTRAELFRWRAVSEYARSAQLGLVELTEAADEVGAKPVIPYVQKAIASMVRVILRADDSGGAIGGLIRSLLSLHAELCALAPPPPARLVRWLIKFQFDGTQDFFEPDIVAYADALGPKGLARYRRELAAIGEQIPPEPAKDGQRAPRAARWDVTGPYGGEVRHSHTRFLLQYNAERLAVVDRDVERIIEVYGGDQTRSYRLHDVSKALVEIGEYDLAITFAERGTLLEDGFQAENCGRHWCDLLAEHRPAEEFAARRLVFERWPSSSNATRLYQTAGNQWTEMEDEVLARLAARAYDYILFLLLTLDDVPRAWSEAHLIDLDSPDLWGRLVEAYTPIAPAAVMPVLCGLIEADLRVTDVRNYRSAIKRLRQLRAIAAGLDRVDEVDALVAELRQENRARTRFLRELDKAGL